jgi:hypothetical protein
MIIILIYAGIKCGIEPRGWKIIIEDLRVYMLYEWHNANLQRCKGFIAICPQYQGLPLIYLSFFGITRKFQGNMGIIVNFTRNDMTPISNLMRSPVQVAR